MKLPLIVVFTFIFVVQLHYVECGLTSSPFLDVINSISNRTIQITNYVREKKRQLQNFYEDNVRKKISSYFHKNATEKAETQDDKIIKIKRKYRNMVGLADATDTKVLNDSLAPEPPIGNKSSDDDPAIHMSTPQLLAMHGYQSESHTIVTDDGYILTVHRIPHSKNSESNVSPKKTVLLHHGLLGSSADWIIPGPKKGLAYYLSDAGYDVWLANVRGNTYSRAHVSRPIESFEFWNFTFHEVGQYDLPAVIDYITAIKGWGVKINYIGHSMGTTVLFVLLSTKPQYNKVLRAGYALAPVAFMTDIRSPIRLLAKYTDNLAYLMKLLGTNEFLPRKAVLKWLSKHACEINDYEEVICENSMFVLCGHDERQFNKTLLPLILGHVPAGASTKTLIHYAQEFKQNGMFQMFDYGPADNFKAYGNVSPPEYPLQQITLPIALLGSENDWLASDTDVTNLYVQLVNPIEHYIVPLKEFNHIDFLWAVDAPTLVYAKLLQLLEEGLSKRYASVDIIDDNPINKFENLMKTKK